MPKFFPGKYTDAEAVAAAKADADIADAITKKHANALDHNGVTQDTAIATKPTEGAWTDYSAISTIVGWSSFVVKQIYYKKVGQLVFVAFRITGTSNSVAVSFTLPYAAASAPGYFSSEGAGKDNGVFLNDPTWQALAAGASILNVYKNFPGDGWTASGDKQVYGQFWYETP